MERRNARHYYKIGEKFFNMIKEGKKTVDARLYDDKGQNLQVGDQLVFLKEPEMLEGIRTRILTIETFKNFKELADGINPIIFGLSGFNKTEFAEFYNKFHLRSQIENFGIVAFEFEPDNKD